MPKKKKKKYKDTTKHMYKIIAKLTGLQKDNPMPNAYPDWDLAEHFAHFFIDKITKIWNELDQYALYEPGHRDGLTTLNMFNPISDNTVKKLVREIKCKSCELDWVSPNNSDKETSR